MDIVIPNNIKLAIIDTAIDIVAKRIERREAIWLCYRLADAVHVVGRVHSLQWEPNHIEYAIVTELRAFVSVNGRTPNWWSADPFLFYTKRMDALNAFREHIIVQMEDES